MESSIVSLETISTNFSVGICLFKIDYDGDAMPDDPDFDDGGCGAFEKDDIPDDYLWEMFSTGVSFNALSTILKLAFEIVNVGYRFNTSKTHLYRSYRRLLEAKEKSYMALIRKDKSYGTICFDHQNTRNISGKFEGSTHRLALVWYSNKIHNVLGMKAMPNKTAISQTLAIKEACEEFNIESEQIVAISCDNEPSNVGHRAATIVLLEQEHNKSLLRLLCRHHSSEIVVKDVYHYLFDADTPNNIFYAMLRPLWSGLREADFPTAALNEGRFTEEMDMVAFETYEELKTNAIQELRMHAKNKHIRDDYKEVTLLALQFFGENIHSFTKNRRVKFRTLINPSNARFMASIIQGIEVYLFRRSRDWETPELRQMKRNIMRFAFFASLIYIRYWNRSTILFDAPINDLRMLQELQKYKLIDAPVADAAISALSRHLNYMSQELAPLSVFSTKLSVQEKNEIAEKLCSTAERIAPRETNQLSNHTSFDEALNDANYDWSSKRVIDLIGERSLFFFDTMNLPRGFLSIDAGEWDTSRDYMRAREIVQSALVCINDGSERVVSNSKYKLQRQRCRKESTFRQNILNLHVNPNMYH